MQGFEVKAEEWWVGDKEQFRNVSSQPLPKTVCGGW